MSKSTRSAMAAKAQWTVNNRPLNVSGLHGARFRSWFDQQFNLSSLDNKTKRYKMSEENIVVNEVLAVDAQDNKSNKVKTHSSIALKIETKAQLETYRKYPRETYDEILDRLFAQIESRKGKKKESE